MTTPTTRRKPPNERTEGVASQVTEVEERFGQLQAQFDKLKSQVRQVQQLGSLGKAAAMFAHEVNNLLTPILSYARAAVDSDNEKLRQKALSVTVSNVEMLTAMSRDVLEMNAAKTAEPEAVSLCDAVESAKKSLCRDLSKDGISFSLEVAASLKAWADPLQLRQVLFNLFLNAREAMASLHEGRLKVSANKQGQEVVIEVFNTGNPIPPDLLPHIFDAFQSSKKNDEEGRTRCSGLGLALCRDLIEANGGTITVASTPDSGTTFRLTLPVAPA